MIIIFPQIFPHIDKFSSTPLLQCPTETSDDGDSPLPFGIWIFIHCEVLKYEITDIVFSLNLHVTSNTRVEIVLISTTSTLVQIVRSPKFKKSTFWLRVLKWKTAENFWLTEKFSLTFWQNFVSYKSLNSKFVWCKK